MREDTSFAHLLTKQGLAWQSQGRLDAALQAFAQAVALEPLHAGLYINLGSALNDMGRCTEAEVILRRGIEIDPKMAQLHNNLGFALRRQGRLLEAAIAFLGATHLAPDDPVPFLNLGTIQTLLCRFDEATRAHRRALMLQPDLARRGGNLLYTLSYHPTMPAAEIVAEFTAWGKRMCRAARPLPIRKPNNGRRLRVGYVSPDFRNHTTRFYLLPLLQNIDRDAFELFAYSSVMRPDANTAEMEPLFDHWSNIYRIDDEEACALIRADELDLLIDLTGHMEANRLGIFARRAAPVQATWLGSCWTTGLPTMDYAIHDSWTAPPGSDALFTERVWRLPHSLFCFQPDHLPPAAPRPAPRNGYIAFGYSGRSERLNELVFKAWAEILRRTPTARLVLDFGCFGDPHTADAFRAMLQKAGIDTTRVDMRCSPSATEALAGIDILLDSFPHSGGTMLFDAIWAGVPFVTLASRPPVGRIGAGIMHNLEMPDWIASDVADYITIATEKAANPDLLAALSSSLRARAEASPLGDAALFANCMGRAYRGMIESMSEEAVTMANERPE